MLWGLVLHVSSASLLIICAICVLETNEFVAHLFRVLKTGEYLNESTINKTPAPGDSITGNLKPKADVDTAATVIPKVSSQVDLNVGNLVQPNDARLTDTTVSNTRRDQYEPNSSSKGSDSSRNGSPSYRDRKRRLSPVQNVRHCLVLTKYFFQF